MNGNSDVILRKLRETVGVPDTQAGDALCALGTIESYQKGSRLPLYHNGKPSLYLLLSGCVCCELVTPDGRSVVECIAYQFGRVANPVGMFTSSQRNERCSCQMDSVFAVYPMDKVQELIGQDVGLMRMYTEVLTAALDEHARHKYMLTLHAEERYRWFQENYSEIAESIPMRTVAQYLNIDPATLSRIRGKQKA